MAMIKAFALAVPLTALAIALWLPAWLFAAPPF